jgi:hypothetical protein
MRKNNLLTTNIRSFRSQSMKGEKPMIARRGLWTLMAMIILAAISLAQSGMEVGIKQKKSQELTGTWATTVTPPPESGASSFKLNFTFTEDGNLLAAGTGGDFPALGNPCQGSWARTSKGEYALTYLCFDFDGGLQFTGTDKIRGAITIDRTTGQLSGRLDLTHFDTNGNLDFNGCCATVQGARVQIERVE